MTEPITTRQKRLIHRSRYRGCREADIIFGRFADAHVNNMDQDDLDRYEALIEESDHDLLAWLMDREPVPKRHDNDIFEMLRRFNAGPDRTEPVRLDRAGQPLPLRSDLTVPIRLDRAD